MSIVTRIRPISAKAPPAPQDGPWGQSSAAPIEPPPVPKWVVYPVALAISLSLWYCLAELVLLLWRLVF